MARPRFPAQEAREENQVRSKAADSLEDSIKCNEPEENDNLEYEMNCPSFPSRSDYSSQGFLGQIPCSSAYYQATQAFKRSIQQDRKHTSTRDKPSARPRYASVDSENRMSKTCEPREQNIPDMYQELHDVLPNSSERSWPIEHPNILRSMEINQVSHQYYPSVTAQTRSTERQNSGSMPPDQPSLQAGDYSRSEQTFNNLLESFFQSRLNSNESQVSSGQQSQTERHVELSDQSMIIILREIKVHVLEKPHLEEFKTLVQDCFEYIARFGLNSTCDIRCLWDLEIHLTTKAFVSGFVRNKNRGFDLLTLIAKKIAKSDTSYLSFCSTMLMLIRKRLSLVAEGYKSHLFGPHYSDRYFAEAIARINTTVERMDKSFIYSSSRKIFFCDHDVCVNNYPELCPTLTREYYMIHLQDYHNEDIGFTQEKDLMRRSTNSSYWYCSGCLHKAWIYKPPPHRWICPTCGLACEENRIKARQKPCPKEWAVNAGLDNTLPSPLDRTSPLQGTTTGTDSSILIASDTTQQLLPAASTWPAVITGPSRLLETSTP
jgi:hypothetical protein